MNSTPDLLLSCSRTCAIQCLIALWAIGPLPVTQLAVVEAVGESDESVKRGLRRLRALGLALCDEIGGKETNWRLSPAVYQLPLPLDLLGLGNQDYPVQPALVGQTVRPSLQAGTPDSHMPQAGPSNLAASPLQADGQPSGGDTPGKAESPTPRKPESSRAGIIIIESESIKLDSYNNKNKGQNATPLKPESTENSSASTSRPTRHIADVLRALKRKGNPSPVADDPFPEDLRLCVERLVKVGCSRKRAEISVARSPWPAQTILEEIVAWKARKASPAGQGITTSGFPFLVAARIESGDHCPRSDEEVELEDAVAVLEQAAAPEQPTDIPDEPPPFIPVTPPPQLLQPIEGQWVNIWDAALGQLQLEMTRLTFKTWFDGATLYSVEQGDTECTFIITLPTQYQVDWLTNRMTGTVKRVLSGLAGQNITPKFVVYS